MSGEQYSIFIKVDATQVNRATEELGRLGIISDSTEFSIKKLGKAAQEQDVWIKKLSASGREHVLWITKLSAASNEAAVASKTLSGAMESADSNTRKATGGFEAFNKIAKSVHSTFILFVGIELARFLRETAMNVGKAADAYTNMKSQLDLATNSQDELNKAFKESTVIANKYYANVTDIATAYAKFNPIIVSMGRSASDTTKVVSALSASLAISGRNAVDTSETYRQFSQAISGPNIQMEEMNTIIDSNQALWRGLQRQLPDVIAKYGSLKEAISKNAVTSKMLLDATIALGPEFEELAARKVPTMSNALTVLSNNFTMYIGEADKASGASTELATLILDLSDALKGSANDANNLGVFLGVLTQTFAGGKGIISEYVDVINQLSDAYLTLTGRQAQAGANDTEIARLMQLGQGNVPVAELAQGKPTTTPKINPPVSKVDSKAAAKEAKDALEAFKAQIAAQVSAAENAEKIFAAQSANRKKRYELEADQIKGIAELQIRATKSEAMRISIAEEAQAKIIEAINQETNLRQESLLKETEVTQAKLAGVQQELDMADAHKLKMADRLELTTKQSELETELAVKRQEQVQIELDAIGQIQSAERDLAEARQQAEETMVKEEALRQLEIMSSNLEYAKEMATGLAEAFGEVGAAIGGMSVAMAEYDKQSATIEIARKEAVDKAEGDQKRITEINDDATKKQAKAQIKAYGDMTQAAQGFFKKGSKGYEAMGAAVKVFRAFEMAQSAMSMMKQMTDMGSILAQFLGMETTKTTAKIASNSAQQASDASGAVTSATKAVADAGQGDPYTGIIRAAAMLAFMAAIGIAVGGGGGGGSAPATPPPEPGTGTVKGDPFAVSESISKSIGIIEENSSNDLNYSADMLDALYQIRDALGGVENLIASNLTPAISNLMLKFGDGVKQAGFVFRDQRLDKVLASGRLEGYIGARIETESSQMMVTIKKGQTMVAQYGDLFAKAFAGVVTEIKDSIVEVGKVIGVTDAEITERLKGFKIKLGTIDIAGLSAEEAAKKIEAAFSAMSDTMAMKALPEFKDFQQTGEGYKETIVRVAEGINRAKGSLELLGMEAINYTDITNKNKDVAAEITRQTIMAQGDLSEGTRKYVSQLTGSAEDIIDSYKQILNITNLMRGAGFGAENLDRTMINAAGGLAAFEESLQSFRENFMTDEQRLAADTQELSKAFADLNMGMPSSKEQFYEIAKGIDKTTEEGKKLFAQFMTLNPKFAEYIDLSKELANAQEEAFQKEWDRVEAEKAKAKELQDRFESLYFTPQERLNKQMDKLREQFDEMGLTVPKTKDEFRGLVEGLDLTTSNGKRLHDILLGLAPAFSDAANEADRLAEAARKAAEQQAEAARKAFETYQNLFYSPEEKLSLQMENLRKEFDKIGITVIPKTKDEFRKLVESLDVTTEQGKKFHDILISIAPAFSDATNEADRLADAARKAAEEQADAARKAHEEIISKLKETADKAFSDLKSAFQNLENVQQRFIATSKTLKAFLGEILGGNASPENRYLTAASEFRRISGLAAQGNEEALNMLATSGKEFLDASRDYNASSEQFQRDFDAVTMAIENGIAYSESQVKLAEDQLQLARKSVAALNQINEGTLSVKQAIDSLSSTLKDYFAANDAVGLASGAATIVGSTRPEPVSAPAPSGLPADWASRPSVNGIINLGDGHFTMAPGLPGAGTFYANGGVATPGLAMVGEQGPELVSFGSSAYVSTASQTQGFFAGIESTIAKGDADQTNELQALVRLQSAANQQLIKEMKGLKAEMAELARKAKLEAAA